MQLGKIVYVLNDFSGLVRRLNILDDFFLLLSLLSILHQPLNCTVHLLFLFRSTLALLSCHRSSRGYLALRGRFIVNLFVRFLSENNDFICHLREPLLNQRFLATFFTLFKSLVLFIKFFPRQFLVGSVWPRGHDTRTVRVFLNLFFDVLPPLWILVKVPSSTLWSSSRGFENLYTVALSHLLLMHDLLYFNPTQFGQEFLS